MKEDQDGPGAPIGNDNAAKDHAKKKSKKAKKVGMNIQLFAKAPNEKIAGYSLNPDDAQDKARVFKGAFGFTEENAEYLQNQIVAGFDESKCKVKKRDRYGVRFEQIMRIKGPNGKTANVCAAWIKENEDAEPRLVSNYVTRRKGTDDEND